MNNAPARSPRVLHPLLAVTQARLIEFIRQPEAVFWVYIFPLLMIVVLGLAFRSQSQVTWEFDLVDSPGSALIQDLLQGQPDLKYQVFPAEVCRQRLQTGKSWLVLNPFLTDTAETTAHTSEVDQGRSSIESLPPGVRIEYWYDPTRPESPALRQQIDERLQRSAGREDVLTTQNVHLQEVGSRYIDFLVPGLIGMGLMGGGLWGVGFAIVDLRIRKLLKRFVATPMRRSDFLGGVMLSRLCFMVPEILLILAFSWLLFGVQVQGSWLLLVGIVMLAAVQFSGLGLLVASRCKTLESASGLMNLVMLPMWTLCGIFFSWEKFPEIVHPVIRWLPLTPVIDALRGVMNHGVGFSEIAPQLGIMATWTVAAFVVALNIFRWRDN